MTTFTLELNSRPNRTGKYSVMIRATQDRKHKRIKTSVEVKKEDWNPNKKEIRKSDPDYKLLNDALEKEMNEAKSTYRDLRENGIATLDNIKKSVIDSERGHSFITYAKQHYQTIKDSGGLRNAKKHLTLINKLERYLRREGKSDLMFKEITYQFLYKFETYLRTLPNEREPEKLLHPNAVQVQMNVFRAIMHAAIKEGLISADKDPFVSYTCEGVKTQKEKLTIDEINRIVALDIAEGTLLWHCRNYFLFSFYCAGIRVGDLIQLRWCNISDNDSRISYQMGKNHKVRDLCLVPQAQKILSFYKNDKAKSSDYIFPLLDNNAPWAKAINQAERDVMPIPLKEQLLRQISSKTALINKNLKKIAKLAGIDKNISNHIARHSFARVAKQHGIDNAQVKELLAHSRLDTTERYMGNFDTAENDKALHEIFDNKEIHSNNLLEQLKQLPKDYLKDIIKQLNS